MNIANSIKGTKDSSALQPVGMSNPFFRPRNLGQLCWMNAALSAIGHCQDLRHAIETHPVIQNSTPIAAAIKQGAIRKPIDLAMIQLHTIVQDLKHNRSPSLANRLALRRSLHEADLLRVRSNKLDMRQNPMALINLLSEQFPNSQAQPFKVIHLWTPLFDTPIHGPPTPTYLRMKAALNDNETSSTLIFTRSRLPPLHGPLPTIEKNSRQWRCQTAIYQTSMHCVAGVFRDNQTIMINDGQVRTNQSKEIPGQPTIIIYSQAPRTPRTHPTAEVDSCQTFDPIQTD